MGVQTNFPPVLHFFNFGSMGTEYVLCMKNIRDNALEISRVHTHSRMYAWSKRLISHLWDLSLFLFGNLRFTLIVSPEKIFAWIIPTGLLCAKVFARMIQTCFVRAKVFARMIQTCLVRAKVFARMFLTDFICAKACARDLFFI
jgi:hypothetical protein